MLNWYNEFTRLWPVQITIEECLWTGLRHIHLLDPIEGIFVSNEGRQQLKNIEI